MMGYEGRSVLLDDGEEWVNIPLVVREFMRQLNDEVHASRSAMEAMRQEQKEVNLCLRRVMQKQADLDMDNARNTLSLKRNTQDAAHARHTEQIHYLRKRQERLDEKIHQLTVKISVAPQETASSSSDLSSAKLTDKITTLSAKIDACDRELREHIKISTEANNSVEELVALRISSAAADVGAGLKDQMNGVHLRLASAETSIGAHRDALDLLQQDSKRLRGVCGEISEVLESDRRVNKDRVTTCFKTVEKVEALCTAHRSGLEASVARLGDTVEANAGKLRDEAKTSYVELRELLKSSQNDVVSRCNELTAELIAVKEQQRRFQEQLASSEADSAALRALKVSKDLSHRIAELEGEAEQRASVYLPKREFHKSMQETQSALDVLSTAQEEAKTTLQAQAQQLSQSVKTMRAEQRADNDWLHNELGRMGTVVSHETQHRERQERQVASLCDIAHNLSVAVESLQMERARCTSGTVRDRVPVAAASQNGATASPTVSPMSVETADEAARAPPSWESWWSQIAKDTEAKVTAVQHRFERLSHQLNELTAKVDGGARYAQAIVAQHMDHVRQNVKDEVGQQLQAHPAMRELTPALVELEAAKRRVASLELEVQSATLRTERWSAEDAARLPDTGAASSESLQRLAAAEDNFDVLQRRLTQLGERVEEQAQHHTDAMRTMRQLDTRLQDQERMTAKFGADLTAALESVLQTEESLSQHKMKSTSQFAGLHTLIKRWESEVAALSEARVDNAAQSSARGGQEAAVSRLESEMAELAVAVSRVPDDVAAEVTRRLRPVQAGLDALRRDGAESTERCSEALQRSTKEAAEAVASAKGEALLSYREVRESQAHAETALRMLEERITKVEAAAAAAEQTTPVVKDASPAEPSPPPLVSSSALERFAEELSDCHRRLDAQHQRVAALDEQTVSSITEHDETMRRECKRKMDALRDEMLAWVVTYVAAQLKRYRGELRASVEEDARVAQLGTESPSTTVAQPADATQMAELHKRVDDVQRAIDRHVAEIVAQQRREQGEVHDQIEGLHASHAELRREMCDASATQQAERQAMLEEMRDALDEVREATTVAGRNNSAASTSSSAVGVSVKLSSPTATADEEERGKRWKDDVLEAVYAACYTKSLLEERLENIWSSMVSLLARKEDVADVDEKLNGLHQLLQEEFQIEVEKLEEQLSGQLAEKVSLAGLQDLLEEHFMEPETSNVRHQP